MEALKELRKLLKLTQEQMANEFGVSKSLYEKIESGFKKPSNEFMTKVKEKYKFIDANIFFKK